MKIVESQLDLELKSVPALSLMLRERYSLFTAKLFGRVWILAIEEEGWEQGTPTEYRQHVNQIAQVTGEYQIAVVIPIISAKVRNRMVQMRVPFIVPNTQAYLPLAVIDLRESFRGSLSVDGKPLSPAAQVILLIQLQQKGLENQSSKQISSRVGYSRSSVSIACTELEQNHLCETFRKGKEKRIAFSLSPRELWKDALSLLKSPIRNTYWVSWIKPVTEARLSGMSALSELSNLADDRIPTFAMQERDIREGFEQGRFHGCTDKHEADALLEAWVYDPAVLSQTFTVDSLSLYLCLHKNHDERVQSELKTVMEDFPWR